VHLELTIKFVSPTDGNNNLEPTSIPNDEDAFDPIRGSYFTLRNLLLGTTSQAQVKENEWDEELRAAITKYRLSGLYECA